MTYRTGALRMARTDGIITILTEYISAEQRRAIQRLAGQVGHLLPEATMTAHAYRGMQVRNDHVASACYLHSAYIS